MLQSQAALTHPINSEHSKEYKSKDLQLLQNATEKAHEAIMIMEGNIDVMTRLQSFYRELLRTDAFIKGVNLHTPQPQPEVILEQHVTWYNNQLDSMISDMRMIISRAQLLVKISTDRSSFVSHP